MLTHVKKTRARTRTRAALAQVLLALQLLYAGCATSSPEPMPQADPAPLASKRQALSSVDYKAMILRDGALGYWRLDEPSGKEISDSAEKPNHGNTFGTYPDTPPPTLNQPGAVSGSTAAQFYVSNSSTHTPVTQNNWIEIPDNDNQKPADRKLSIEFWFNVTPAAFSPATWSSLVAKTTDGQYANGYGFYTYGGQIYFYMGGRNNRIGVPFHHSSRLHHIVGTYDGATMQLYYDGAFVTGKAWSGAFATDAPLRFGWVPGTTSFTGELDEIALYNDVLSLDKIKAHYQGGIESLPNPELGINQFVLYADRSIRTGTGDGVYGGSVGIASTVTGSAAQLVVGQKNRLDPVRPLFAPSISLSLQDSVGDVYTNSIVNTGGFAGEQNAYPSDMPRLPTAPLAAPGTTDLTVARGETKTVLQGGNFRNITVNGTLTIGPGRYDCENLIIGANANLFAEAFVEIRAAGRIVLAGGNAVRTTGAPAGAFKISTGSADLADGSPVVSIGKAVNIRAVIIAPHGTIALANSGRVVGALAASSITLADSIQIAYESGLPQTITDDLRCLVDSKPGATTLDFSTQLECDQDVAGANGSQGCALQPLTLRATSSARDQGDTYVRWTITRGEELMLTRSTSVGAATTVTKLDFGGTFGGVHKLVLSDDGRMLSGSLDGQAFEPRTLDRNAVDDLRLANGQAPEEIRTDEATQNALFRLLDKAKTVAGGVCAGMQEASASRALEALKSALPQTGFPETKYRASQAGSDQAGLVALRDEGGASGIATSTQALSLPSLGGVPLNPGPGASREQNTFLNYSTPSCQQCQHDCVNTFWNWLSLGGYGVACQLGCFIPGNGCSQNSCTPLTGITGACDNNQACCGSMCCGQGSVCGNDDFGACCPASHPVACGDETGLTCFPPGSHCCGRFQSACPADQGCQFPGNGSASVSCCPSSQTATSGECCARDTCGGKCCDQGACDSQGSCCLGPIVNGTCCPGGLGATVCNGQCCDGSCTASGACCDTSGGALVCGSACCPSGQVCLDANASRCGAPIQPTLQLLGSTGQVRTQTGGPEATVSTGTFTVRGLSYSPGSVVLTADTVGGTVIGGAVAQGSAGAATFTTTLSSGLLTEGSHLIVGWQNVGGSMIQATLPVKIVVIR